MLYRFLIILLLLDALVLMAAVLLQSGKGGGLAASFGGASAGDQLFGARQAGNLLTKITWWSAGIFLLIALTLAIMSSQTGAPRSVLQGNVPAPAQNAPLPLQTAPAPVSVPTPTPAPSPTTNP